MDPHQPWAPSDPSCSPLACVRPPPGIDIGIDIDIDIGIDVCDHQTSDVCDHCLAGKPSDFEQRGRAEAIEMWMDGDEAAMEAAEETARTLVARWGRWMRSVSSEAAPAVRMDFLVAHSGAGRADVHSLELTELGFCMLGWKEGPRAVMSALLESCLELDRLPPTLEAAVRRTSGPAPVSEGVIT